MVVEAQSNPAHSEVPSTPLGKVREVFEKYTQNPHKKEVWQRLKENIKGLAIANGVNNPRIMLDRPEFRLTSVAIRAGEQPIHVRIQQVGLDELNDELQLIRPKYASGFGTVVADSKMQTTHTTYDRSDKYWLLAVENPRSSIRNNNDIMVFKKQKLK